MEHHQVCRSNLCRAVVLLQTLQVAGFLFLFCFFLMCKIQITMERAVMSRWEYVKCLEWSLQYSEDAVNFVVVAVTGMWDLNKSHLSLSVNFSYYLPGNFETVTRCVSLICTLGTIMEEWMVLFIRTNPCPPLNWSVSPSLDGMLKWEHGLW